MKNKKEVQNPTCQMSGMAVSDIGGKPKSLDAYSEKLISSLISYFTLIKNKFHSINFDSDEDLNKANILKGLSQDKQYEALRNNLNTNKSKAL